jgi:hypothetical protein
VIHIRERCRKPDYLRRLSAAGFESVKATYRMPVLALFIWIRKIATKSTGRYREMESDLKPIPSAVNAVLLWMGRVENLFIDLGLAMPFGTSLFVVARKPKEK